MTDRFVPDLSVKIAGVTLKNPVVTASGTFGFGREYAEFFDLSRLGAVAAKGLTLLEKPGNPSPRIAETPSGILNSVGLQNPGVDAFIKEELPFLRTFDTKVIANVAGATEDDYFEIVDRVSDAGVDFIELNISCPNVKAGGLSFGARCDTVERVVAGAKKRAKAPLIVKLTPNVTDIAEIARAAEGAGADALSLINTLLGMRIDVRTRRPVLANLTGGLSGPAVLPVAVRMIYQVKKAVGIPIIGMGGVSSGADAAELMLAGADAVAVGTATLRDPMAPVKVLEELSDILAAAGMNAREITGAVLD